MLIRILFFCTLSISLEQHFDHSNALQGYQYLVQPSTLFAPCTGFLNQLKMTSRNWVSSCKNCGIDVNWMKCLWEYSISDSPQNPITMHSQILLQGRSKHSNIKLRYFWEVSIAAVGVVFFGIDFTHAFCKLLSCVSVFIVFVFSYKYFHIYPSNRTASTG